MADFDNLSEINENFDTIKTLLNSIRAQGILNTSDVDKLLSGINSKLEKINTEEDIDLIKIFLSELKQTLDERHGVLVSKFGAIEALFSNLLKNSSEMLKSSEVKELFDIVATNLSVFSREVVSQKETLTDITLRIDALRSDDTDKKEIIKNIALLKPDLERLNNGFDSIVLSLNDNFKSIIKTITTIDKTEYLDRFADSLAGIDMSVNTVLSALQMLDKKSEIVDETLKQVVTKEDLTSTTKRLVELTAQTSELTSSVAGLSDSYLRLDNLSEKINASVSIIATLKTALEDLDDNNTKLVLEKLNLLSNEVKSVKDEANFADFRASLQDVLRQISQISTTLDKSMIASFEEVLANTLNENNQKIFSLQDANITRVLTELSANSDSLTSKLNDTKTTISGLCERSFGSVFEGITNLKALISQIDENSISANNAIFSSITDRLSLFETALRESLDIQEKTVTHSSIKLVEHIESIKNLSSVIDYKMDASVLETANIKKEFSSLQGAVEDVLALDFVNVVKELRVDLYASKEEINTAVEVAGTELKEKFINELFTKYDLLITKLDDVEDEVKKVQIHSLTTLKTDLENISASILDVLTYVSDAKPIDTTIIENKINKLGDIVKENRLDFIEGVRDTIDVFRENIENKLQELDSEAQARHKFMYESIVKASDVIKEDLKNYNLATQTSIDGVKAIIDDVSENVRKEVQDTNLLSNQNFESVKKEISILSENIRKNFDKVESSTKNEFIQADEKLNDVVDAIKNDIKDVSSLSNQNFDTVRQEISILSDNIKKDFDKVEVANKAESINIGKKIEDTSIDIKNDLKFSYTKLLEIRETYDELKELVNVNQENTTQKITSAIATSESVKTDFENRITNFRAQIFDKITEFKQEFTCENADKVNEIKFTVENMYTKNSTEIKTLLDDLKVLVNKLQSESADDRADVSDKISEALLSLKDYISLLNETAANTLADKVELLMSDLDGVKAVLKEVDRNIDNDLSQQISILESNFEGLVSQISIMFDKSDRALSDKINNEFEQVSENMQAVLAEKIEGYKVLLENALDKLSSKSTSQAEYLQESVETLNVALKDAVEAQARDNIKYLEEITESLKQILDDNVKQTAVDYVSLKDKLSEFVRNIENNNQLLMQNFRAQLDDIAKYIESVLDLQSQDFEARQQDVLTHLNNSSTAVLEKVDVVADIATSTKNDIELLAQSIGANRSQIRDLEATLTGAVDLVKQVTSEASASELQAIDAYITTIVDQIELTKQNTKACQEQLLDFTKKELVNINTAVEKETDVIIAELIEQFDLLKKSQVDDIVNLTSKIEDIVSSQIYSNIEDLKGYLDVKTDNTVMEAKLDNLKIDMTTSVENILSGMNRMLSADTFSTAISDFKLANEVLLNTAVDGLNDRIDSFINDNLAVLSNDLTINTKSIEAKLALFDKKFIEAVADKYEEIKLLVNNYNSSFDAIEEHFAKLASEFVGSKNATNAKLEELTKEVRDLGTSFEGLRDQISSKSFDEAFQASINKQISDLENLMQEQLGYIEDINSLCETNLPDVTEMNVLLKGSLFESVKNFSEKLEAVDVESVMQSSLKEFKSDIITQFINVFNQVSFVAEQEEILDFIQEKHDDLITILSHIVTTTEDVANIKADIAMINDKINSIISSEGDIDYIYSLQDLESDIANLRLALGEMNSEEFSNLVQSTNDIYTLVESIKSELPTKADYEALSEDIVSISTRTNKLILASDESYKALQDNLQEFKLVVNDLDERTRNFAQEAGLDKIDNKLNALNNMMQSGAKTNQVFNQVFEYLAEWVDNASTQINQISDKVETLDEIGQIKDLLVDIKTGNEDNDSDELIEALGSVFDKQTKKISTIEKKLDTIIVETTMNKVDLGPIEKTFTKFLKAMEDKLVSQQDKINNLEAKLEEVMSLLDGKETAQLTKKVGGMDRQIAKLNKSIEKIASHVVEK